MKSKIFKIIGTIIVIPFLYIFIVLVYNIVTIIDETITKGSGYGFAIGQNKEEVFFKAQEIFKDQKVIFSYFDSHSIKQNKLTVIPLEKLNFKEVSRIDNWQFGLNGTSFDNISLKFKDGKIIVIKRSRHPEL